MLYKLFKKFFSKKTKIYNRTIKNSYGLQFPIYKDTIFAPIIHEPLISILLINYNGEENFDIFFDSLKNQTYQNFEIIFVDNNSRDDSLNKINKIKTQFSQPFKIIKNKTNEGFAKGNNIALEYAKGELIALVNLDTRLDKKWLEELFNAMKVDSTVSAVCSKTLFFKKFNDIRLYSTAEFSIDLQVLLNNLNYKKFFLRKGFIKNKFIYSIDNEIIISLPVNENIYIKLNNNKKEVFWNNKKIETQIIIKNKESSNSRYIINNAGSFLNKNMLTGDRGYGEYDIGQYDGKAYVDLFCGVSVLIRRSAITKRELFIPEFFGYYEDSELSVWMRKNNFNILYTPYSKVYHKHSNTFNEFSKEREFLIKRNQKIYLSSINSFEKQKFENLEKELDILLEEYEKQIDKNFYIKIKELNDLFFKRVENSKIFYPKRISIGIYNSFWNTKGGGEKHALEIGKVLQQYGDVYLISERDFCLKELGEYFKLNLDKFIKIVESKIYPPFTKNFDIFINTTYTSSLISLNKNSYYIVSFPHTGINKDFLKSYKFIHNSHYTKKWAENWWGVHENEVLYPLGGINVNNYFKKEKIILSVGRFFIDGHNKNQLEIAKVFSKIVKNNKLLSDWKLVLIGGVNLKNEKSKDYIKRIEKELKGVNYELIYNADFSTLNEYYKKAYIYVHATGLNRNEIKEPEKFEHFGISVVEAISKGCYPIVLNKGGLKEITSYFKVGRTFRNEKELYDTLIEVMREYPKSLFQVEYIDELLNKYNFESKVRKIFKEIKDE